mmetsp:Transcript_129801/g.403716  ORF Transcript_129801/g.403716 Transcript_129801/m.403716 type:complete len:215 (-) Transcript_129801:81-725(-)
MYSLPMFACSTSARARGTTIRRGALMVSAAAWYVFRWTTSVPNSRPPTSTREQPSQTRTRSSPDLRGRRRSSHREATSRHERRRASRTSFWTEMPAAAFCAVKSFAAKRANANASSAAEACQICSSVKFEWMTLKTTASKAMPASVPLCGSTDSKNGSFESACRPPRQRMTITTRGTTTMADIWRPKQKTKTVGKSLYFFTASRNRTAPATTAK